MPKRRKIQGLYTIIDTALVSLEEIEHVATEMIRGGAKIIQLRAKDSGGCDPLKAATLVWAATRGTDTLFIVNDRIDIALMTDADGIHLGQEDTAVEEARRQLGELKIIGLSTHNLSEAIEAAKLARSGYVDYISFGPIFATNTKPSAGPPRGLKLLKEVRGAVSLPITAIGGIKEGDVEEVLREGADSVAMISEILASGDIHGKVLALTSLIRDYNKKRE